jgi:hypothetical protein
MSILARFANIPTRWIPVIEKTIIDKFICVPAEIYSRVSGYYRPVMQWNKAKQKEFSERKTLDVEKALRR